MTRAAALTATALLSRIMLGCGEPNPREPHNAPLLDNKVLQQRVEAALHSAGPDFQNVHVKTDSGTVILTGPVPSADARAKAEEISRSVYGAKKLDNQLSLKRTGSINSNTP